MKTPAKKSAGPVRQSPRRTCVACRQIKPQRELIRLVRTADGTIAIDKKGKTDGRGAYVCVNPACWEKALQGNSLEHTFRSKIKPENREQLQSRGASLLKEMTIDQGEKR